MSSGHLVWFGTYNLRVRNIQMRISVVIGIKFFIGRMRRCLLLLSERFHLAVVLSDGIAI